MLSLLAGLTGSYLIGSIPTGFLLVAWLKKVDVRKLGSGNVGATNVARVAGKKASGVVFALDLAKGLVAAGLLAPWLLGSADPLGRLACGLAAVLGHTFPVFLAFRGGKGVATTIGVLVAASPWMAAVFLGLWAVSAVVWRYVSVSSIVAGATIPLTQLVMRQGLPETVVGSCLGLLIVVRHRENITRLLQGREPKIRS